MKPHISTILKKGAKLKSGKLTKKDLALIEKTILQQQKLIDLMSELPLP